MQELHTFRTEILTYLIADVANTCPLEPTDNTTTDATTTIKSDEKKNIAHHYSVISTLLHVLLMATGCKHHYQTFTV